ncbi:nucleotidyltransferase [Gordonia terrae]|uniref:Nucleotidyltransferase n=2 Tax=Gordonia terrae TaxID=2055 RepID=A0AAD0KB99_9ACTN|nr:nucleotidyltransferase [Gordonia terrae]AWO85110.1 nucleotidyltransferase [Gordonia terrae]VTR10788.1 Nucleotidyltransferase [Clostridioides difficile]VTS58608.1 Uncharacterised protein [Gordonia terrae]
MSMEDCFTSFVEKISLGQKQVDRIESSSSTLMKYLRDTYNLTDEQVFLQGSYANGTAVKPVDGGEYDVDIICVCASTEDSATSAIEDLYQTLDDNGRYSGKLTSKQPCVRIQYADDEIGSFHVDVVPVRVSDDPIAPLDAPRKSSGWHPTAPSEYTSWCEDQGVEFRETVKMLKRWRDENQDVRGAIKSIVLQVLISEHMPASSSTTADRVASVFTGLADALADLESAPDVWNPVLPTENLAARWTNESFQDFKRELKSAAETVQLAVDAETDVEATEYWRDIFGGDFPAVQKNAASYAVKLGDTSHAQSPDAMNWYVHHDSRYRVSVKAWVQLGNKRNKRLSPYQSDGGLVSPGRWIKFNADLVSPTTASIWWRVTNTGKHARDQQGLRGDFFKGRLANRRESPDERENWESTSYTGSHLVEVFVVVGNRVVAESQPYYVNIHHPRIFWRP